VRITSAILFVTALLGCGCGAGVSADFANRLIGADGELIAAEEVDAIVADPNLTDDEKRDALRDLGVEDEELINALLTL
jgi:hypothetical protein